MHNDSVYFNRIKSLKDLKNYSFKIGSTPILVSRGGVKIEKISNLDFVEIPNNVYTRNGIYVAFKMEENLYILPCSRRIDKFLEENGFSQEEFNIPFTEQEEYPVEESSAWIELYMLFLNGVL